MDPVKLVASRGGVARRVEVLSRGATRHAVEAALRTGLLVVPARGVLALPSLSAPRAEAARLRARLTCVSRIAEAGLPVLSRPRQLHLAVGSRSRAPQTDGGVRTHYSSQCGRSLAPMPVPIALDHAGLCVDARAHLVMVDAALRAGRLKGGDLVQWSATRRDRRAWLLAHADPRAESAQETLARLDLVEAGIRAVPQVYLDGVGRVDLLVEGRLVVETDGRAYHDGDDAFSRDRRRDRTSLRGSYLTARFTAAEIQSARPGEIAAEIAAILRANPRAPIARR
ncbi:hypothetical protein [Demequina pelophila]|uniref:hypothetical protein n=1 Tax=Demequina pelophila TaxID=1638984 RepID=UPI000785F1DC|nr:hypothetical protein [Demequina pelophila]